MLKVTSTDAGSAFLVDFVDPAAPPVPSLPAIAPSFGSASGGNLLLLGLAGYRGGLPSTLVSRVSVGVANADILGVATLGDWERKGPGYAKIAAITGTASILNGLGDGMNAEFLAVPAAVRAVLEKRTDINGTQADVEGTILVCRAPAYVGGYTNGLASVAVKLFIAVGGGVAPLSVEASRMYSYQQAPSGASVVSIITDSGRASCGLAGGVMAYVSVTSFPIVYTKAEVAVTFGSTAVQVVRLRASTPAGTVVDVIVPAGAAGSQTVTVRAVALPTSEGQATFTYVDDAIPVILGGYAPYTHYTTGGFPITASATHLSGLKASDIRVLLRLGADYASRTYPTSVVQAPLLGPGAVTLVFTPPPGPPGVVTVRFEGGGKTSSAATIQLVSPPTGPPQLTQVTPASAGAGVNITVTLRSFLIAPASAIRVRLATGNQTFYLSGAQGQLSVPSSSIDRTLITFPSPRFSADGDVNITVHAVDREALSLTALAYKFDLGFARLEYLFPAASRAGDLATIEVYIARFGQIGSFAGLTFRASPPDGLTQASVMTYEPRDDGSAVLTLQATRVGAAPGRVRFEVCIATSRTFHS